MKENHNKNESSHNIDLWEDVEFKDIWEDVEFKDIWEGVEIRDDWNDIEILDNWELLDWGDITGNASRKQARKKRHPKQGTNKERRAYRDTEFARNASEEQTRKNNGKTTEKRPLY